MKGVALAAGLVIGILPLVTCCLPSGQGHARGADVQRWNSESAATYLDHRTDWWIHNMGAIDQGTACVSCHTALPYAMARATLRPKNEKLQISKTEAELLASVKKRVEKAATMAPFLSGPVQSRGTESVLNVVVLTQYQPDGAAVSHDLSLAYQTLWERQIKSGPSAGSWAWFSLGNEPWEAPDSQYWGATLAAKSIGEAPEGYRSRPNIQSNLIRLRTYLKANESTQSLYNQLALVIANRAWPGLISSSKKAEIVARALAMVRSDGGWRAADLIPPTWPRRGNTPQHPTSGGFGTAFVVYALEEAQIPGARSAIDGGKGWLLHHQDPTTGAWIGYSVNEQRDLNSDVGKFMTDAATAYAILALTSHP